MGGEPRTGYSSRCRIKTGRKKFQIMKNKGPEIFLRKKPSQILVSLHGDSTENYASALSTKVDCTYSHTVRLIQKFNDLGLIETRKEGRKKIVELTDEGEIVASNLSEVFTRVD